MTTTISNDHPTEHARLTPQRLVRRVDRASRLLAERLDAARSDHDLTWRGLLSVQDGIGTAHDQKSAPSVDVFWTETAEPMAQPLVAASCEAIEESIDLVTSGIRRLGTGTAVHSDHLSAQVLMRWSTIAMDQTALNSLGQRWQKRLRRQAIIPTIASAAMEPAGDFTRHLEQTEMSMLDQPPWLHGDRLLTAFEFAHADVRTALRQGRTDIEAAFAVARGDSVIVARGSRQQFFGSGGERRP